MSFWGVSGAIYIIAVFVSVLFWYLERRRINKHIGHLNKYPTLPIIGSTHLIAFKDTQNISETLEKYLRDYDLPCVAWIGPIHPMLVITDPDDVLTFLSDPHALDKPYIYKFFKNERGLVTSPPNIWRTHRKILNPSFSFNVLKTLIPMFKQKVDKLIDVLNEAPPDSDIDMLDHLYMCTLDMITASTTEVDIDTKSEETKEYLKAIIDGADLIATRMIKVYLHMEWAYRLSYLYTFEKNTYKIVYRYLRNLINSKKDMFDATELANEEAEREKLIKPKDNDEAVDGKPKIVINQLFRNWKKGVLEYKDVRDELDVLIYTGSDTSTHLAAYTLLMLAMHPEIQDKVIKELQSVFVDRNVPVDYDSIKQLVYLDMVIKETLRLYPVIPYIGRYAAQDIKLKEFTVPRRTIVFVPLLKMSRDPKVWGPDANKFNPDNFLPENYNKLHFNQFIPFSCGPRNCIGKTYAILGVRTIVSQVLINFIVKTSLKLEDINLVMNITLRITNDNLIRLEKRTDFWK